MKRLFFLLCLFILNKEECTAQNLVPNPSFEIYSICGSQINYAIPWYNPTTGTPDYFDSCANNVPFNAVGYQFARTGVGYVGIYTYAVGSTGGNERKEYIQVQLIDTLIAQKKYCVKFYVNLAIPSSGWQSFNYLAITKMGIYISDTAIFSNNQYTLSYTAQIESPSGVYLTDTTNWVEVSGHYIAHGGEKYITIGNFNYNSDTIGIINNNFPNYGSYYYIDDVSIIDCTDEGVNELNISDLKLYPNPATDKIVLEISNLKFQNANLKVFNILGEEVLVTSLIKTKTEIDISNLPQGIYFIELQTENEVVRKKFVKE